MPVRRFIAMTRFLLVIWLCCVPLARAQSLCTSEETSLFTCSIGERQVSVCASKELSRTSGYVQYRAGRPEQAPELAFPAQKVHPAQHFSVGSAGSAKSSLVNLHFEQSGYSYTVYRQSAAFDTNGAGVRVKAPDGRSSRLRCREESPPSDLERLADLGLRRLPEESLVSVDELETWPADSPSADLLWGVRTHDFALVTKALAAGADINFHGPDDVGVLGSLIDGRGDALRGNRAQEFDDETERLLALLLSRGASPALSMSNGATSIDALANRASDRVVRTLLDAGWPKDFQYRLYAGALLGDPVLIGEALDNGADPNRPVRGARILSFALGRAGRLSDKSFAVEQARALSAVEQLLAAGARIEAGAPDGGGDIVLACAHWGANDNIQPLLDLLIRHATPAAKRYALNWARVSADSRKAQGPDAGASALLTENILWLIDRLERQRTETGG